MSDDKEFYVGWQDKMPKQTGQFLKRRILILFLLIPIIAIGLVLGQRHFANGIFELGKLSQITGTYSDFPVPMLLNASTVDNRIPPSDVLLVGYGKYGARGIMDQIQSQHDASHGYRLTLQGTLIHGGDKVVLELTQKEASLIDAQPGSAPLAISSNPGDVIAMTGEILDPKCYFGVMKPGEGKIHKSCAIRCISGGIPPVFRKGEGTDPSPYEYYILLESAGDTHDKSILPYVGEDIELRGRVSEFYSWNILYADVADINQINH